MAQLLPPWWPVALVAVVAVVLTWIKLAQFPIYLTADAGHYLADADAVFGNGVRESRHLPLFPVLIGASRFVFGDLGGITAAMLAVIVLLVVGFHYFVGQRLASPGAEAVGALFFILSPVFAEGVGWYGASMLLGLALALIAMRFVDDVLVAPSVLRVVRAGVMCGLVGLTHPLPFLVLVQVSAIAAVVLVVRGARRRRLAGRPVRPWLLQRLCGALGVAVVTGAIVLPWLHFYTQLESPVVLSFNPAQLATLSTWAFREDLPLWIGLVGVSALVLLGASRRLHSEPQYRMAVWAIVACAVPIATVLLVNGNPSYTSRYLYLLPLTLGCTVAVGCAVLARQAPTLSARAKVWAAALLAVALFITAVRAGQSYARRLEVALAYYSAVSAEELEAIRWVRDRPPGTVAVSAKGGDKVAGTLYAWMLEGLAKKRALGTDQAFVALLESAHLDSLDIERLLSGSTGVENGRLRIAGSEGDRTPIEVAGLIGGDWFPLITLDMGPTTMPDAPSRAEATIPADVDRGDLLVEHHGAVLQGSLSTSRDFELALSVVQSDPTKPLALDIRPSLAASNALLRAAGDEGALSLTLPGGQARILVSVDGGLPVHVEQDARSGTGRIRVEADPGHDLSVTIRVDGLAPLPVPELTTFDDLDLIRRHNVRSVFTWKQTALAPALADRRCFTPAMENDEVVVLDVKPECVAER